MKSPRNGPMAPAALGALLLLACGSGGGIASRSAATLREVREPEESAAVAPNDEHAGHDAAADAGAGEALDPVAPARPAAPGAPGAGLAPDPLDRPAPVAEAAAARAREAVEAMGGHAHGGEYRHLDAGREAAPAPAAEATPSAEPGHAHPAEPPEGDEGDPGQAAEPEGRPR